MVNHRHPSPTRFSAQPYQALDTPKIEFVADIINFDIDNSDLTTLRHSLEFHAETTLHAINGCSSRVTLILLRAASNASNIQLLVFQYIGQILPYDPAFKCSWSIYIIAIHFERIALDQRARSQKACRSHL